MRALLAALYSRDFCQVSMMTKTNLKFLTINVTESCNAACRYCNWGKQKRPAELLSRLLAAVDDAAAIGVRGLRLSGGEPLLRRDMPDLISHARNRGLATMMCTAANQRPESLIACAEAGLDVLSISLDTCDPVVFKYIRGYDIEVVLSNISALAALRSRLGFEIVLSVVLTRPSLAGLSSLLEFAVSQDLVVNITPFQDGTPPYSSTMNDLAMRPEDEPALRRAVDTACEAAGHGLRLLNSDEFLMGIVDFCMTSRLSDGYTCCAGYEAAIRMAGGEMKLCHSLPGIQAADIRTAWFSGEAAALRDRMTRLDCPHCWLSCHADRRRQIPIRFGRTDIWEAI
jgi:MoaA/NifB/PqqE/SkfB family radical SAM enzyme